MASSELTTGLQIILASLRTLQWCYHSAHWQARGSSSYGDHILLKQLYESVLTDVDDMGEKMVGLCGSESADGRMLFLQGLQILVPQTQQSTPMEDLKSQEETLQTALKRVYDGIKSREEMTLGLDDFLMSLANKHEQNLYFLKQRIGAPQGPDPMESPSAVRVAATFLSRM